MMKKIYGKVVDNKIIEVDVLDIHISNREDNATYLPIRQVVKPIETLDKIYAPKYSIHTSGEYILKEWAISQRSEADKPKFIEAKKKAKQDRTVKVIESHLNNTAKLNGYDSILSACTYSGYPNPFKAEGDAFVEWRGNVWAHCYQVMAEVEAGTRAEPTPSELLREIPVLALP